MDFKLELQNVLKEDIKKVKNGKKERFSVDLTNINREVKKDLIKKYGRKFTNNVVDEILKKFTKEKVIKHYKITVNKKNENIVTVTVLK